MHIIRESPPLRIEEIVDQLSEPLRRHIARTVASSADSDVVDDLLEETLIRVARGLDSFAGRASLRTWTFSIATHVVRDHFRTPAHRARTVVLDASAEPPDHARAVDERLVVDEMHACVRELIDRLPEDYRAAVVLHDLGGMTAVETAAACRCSAPTAKIRIHRARRRLGDALRSECELYHDPDDVLRCDRKPRDPAVRRSASGSARPASDAGPDRRG